jgi:hypothetical protein
VDVEDLKLLDEMRKRPLEFRTLEDFLRETGKDYFQMSN